MIPRACLCDEDDDDECVFIVDSETLEGRRQGNDRSESVMNLLTLTNPLSILGHVTLSHKKAHIHLPNYPQRKIYSPEIALPERKRLNGALSYDSAKHQLCLGCFS